MDQYDARKMRDAVEHLVSATAILQSLPRRMEDPFQGQMLRDQERRVRQEADELSERYKMLTTSRRAAV